MHRKCFLKHVIVWKIEEIGRRRRRGKQLLDDFKKTTRYKRVKWKARDRTLWRSRFGGVYGPVVRVRNYYCYYYYYYYVYTCFLVESIYKSTTPTKTRGCSVGRHCVFLCVCARACVYVRVVWCGCVFMCVWCGVGVCLCVYVCVFVCSCTSSLCQCPVLHSTCETHLKLRSPLKYSIQDTVKIFEQFLRAQ